MWLFNKKIRFAERSPKWKVLRDSFIKKNPCCSVCGSCAKPEVHHIIPVHLDPEKELEDTNLITLCDKYCHFVFGHLMNWKNYNPHIIEDAKIFNKKIKERL